MCRGGGGVSVSVVGEGLNSVLVVGLGLVCRWLEVG